MSEVNFDDLSDDDEPVSEGQRQREEVAQQAEDDQEILYGDRLVDDRDPDQIAADEAEGRRLRREIRAGEHANQLTGLSAAHKSAIEDMSAGHERDKALWNQLHATWVATNDPAQKAQLRQILDATSPLLIERETQKAQSQFAAALAEEQARLFQLRPDLESEDEIAATLAYGENKYGYSQEQLKRITDVSTVMRLYDEFCAHRSEEQGKKSKAEREKRAKSAEKKRWDNMSKADQVQEQRGELSAAIMMYGDSEAKAAHRRAVERNRERNS